MFKKILSLITLFVFTSSILLPVKAEACWWKGLPYRGTAMAGADPNQGGYNDNKRNQPDNIADNVFLHNGDFMYSHQDIFIPSRAIGVEITRSYKSQSRFNGAFGLGWEIIITRESSPWLTAMRFILTGKEGNPAFCILTESSISGRRNLQMS